MGNKKKPAGKSLKKPDTSGLVAAGVFDESQLGFEDADRDSFSIPFLAVLQKMSPQCDKDASEFIKGAEPGMFFNTATQELCGSSVKVIPCAYLRQLIEWIPRDQGGGFRGSHAVESINIASLERDDSGRFVLPNGNHLMDTRYHFILYLSPNGPQPVVISLASTQIKTSRNWMTAMRDFRAMNPKTKQLQSVPMMANVWKLSTITQSNEKGTWKGVKAEHVKLLDMPKEVLLYTAAKEFHAQIATGSVHAETPTDATGDESPIF